MEMYVSVYSTSKNPLKSSLTRAKIVEDVTFLNLEIGENTLSLLLTKEELLEMAANINGFFMMEEIEEKGKLEQPEEEDKDGKVA
jgi:hypothetical protein